jgi:hypothetical protein
MANSIRPQSASAHGAICPIWPPSGHLFHVHPAASLVDVRPRGVPNGGSNMARKTYNSVEHDQSEGTELEAKIREFMRRDVVTNREGHPDNESEMAASSINSVLQRATTTSVQEIDKLITELQALSDTLHRSARGFSTRSSNINLCGSPAVAAELSRCHGRG